MTVFGVDVPDLPDGWTVLEVAVIAKCLDDEGRLRLISRYSEGLTAWEALGMLDAEHTAQRGELEQSFRAEDGP